MAIALFPAFLLGWGSVSGAALVAGMAQFYGRDERSRELQEESLSLYKDEREKTHKDLRRSNMLKPRLVLRQGRRRLQSLQQDSTEGKPFGNPFESPRDKENSEEITPYSYLRDIGKLY